MAKKFLAIASFLVIMLLTSTFFIDVKANIQDDNIIQIDDKKTESIWIKETTNFNNEIDIKKEQNKPPAREKVQYTITEAPGLIESNFKDEKIAEDTTDKRFIDPNKPMIAITYDDGPSKHTPEILNILKENNSVATFFVLGSQVYNNKDVLNSMIGR